MVRGGCGGGVRGHVLAAMALTVALLAPAEKGTMAGPAQNPLDL